MSFNASQSNMTFSYGTIGAQQLTVIDVKKVYTSLGGSITPETSVQFSPHLPNRAYSRTALTSGMPPTYLCRGSINAHFLHPDGRVDVVSISVYHDTSRGAQLSPLGPHLNLFLQYDINGVRNHTNNIPNRHIRQDQGLILKASVGASDILSETIPPIGP